MIKEGFDTYPAKKYDEFSEVAGFPYAKSSEAMAERIQEVKPDAKVVLEIGSGTGNSALEILKGVPSVELLVGVEKGDLLWAAHAKMKDKVDDFFAPEISPSYSQRTAKEWQSYKDRFRLVKAKGEQLPFASESMDVVFMCQVFHWLEPHAALNEIHRVLKPGGILVFDESDTQFNFGDTDDGRNIKERHTWNHAFARLFQKNFAAELAVHRISMKSEPFAAPSSYLFDLQSLESLLGEHGFELQRDTNDKKYSTVPVPMDVSGIKRFVKNGARMRITKDNIPALFENSELADGIIAEAYRKTEREWEEKQHGGGPEEFGSTMAVFVARKAVGRINKNGVNPSTFL